MNSRILAKLKNEFGPSLMSLLNDATQVIEIMVNADGCIWIDELGKGISLFPESPLSSMQRECIIATLAHINDTNIGPQNPSLKCTLPFNNERFQGLLPPIVEEPTFSIRKRSQGVIPLRDYVEQNRITDSQYELIRSLIKSRTNIVVAGATASGKTTFINALINELGEIHPHHRIIIIEDTLELQCSAENHLRMNTVEDKITMSDLLKAALRLRPDRIIIGEVRSHEARTFLHSLNTGHPGGFCTIHAESAEETPERFEDLISEVCVTPQKRLIERAIDYILYMRNRYLEKIVRLDSLSKNGDYIMETVY